MPGSSGVKTAATVLSEDFEGITKANYTNTTLYLKSGAWNFNDALIGTGKKDAFNGLASARIRNNGNIRMLFDVAGVSKVLITHAAYAQSKSEWQLRMSVDGGRTFTQVGATMLSTSNDFRRVTFFTNYKGSIRFEIRKTSGGKSRINIDDFTILGYNGQTDQNSEASAQAIADTPRTGDNSDLLLGNPSNATAEISNADNYLMRKPYYTLSYNRSKGEPNWVSWYVGTASLGYIKRINDFRPDNSLPQGWYQVQPTSFYGSGFERGHNCPSADRTSSKAANSSTFLMTNMIPQAPANNQHTWGNLESYERLMVKQGNEVFVIMGSYGSGGYGTSGFHTVIDKGRVVVPSHIWKVIVVIPDGNDDLHRINSLTRVIAVDTPNNNGIGADWTKYLCTVRDIEKATGYNLLSALPKSVQDAIETVKDAGANADDRLITRIPTE